ncbi:MAG: LapA family protein [Deltaproteobacteria bacterium]|nr:LapA family protein [Deltaproteobacteria bacterium]
MNHLRMIVVIFFILLVIIVAVQNYQAFSNTVTFRINLIFVDWESSAMSMYFVAVITFLVGILVAGIYGITERFHLKKRIKTLTKEAREKDKELNSLRNLPVTGEEMVSNQTPDLQ